MPSNEQWTLRVFSQLKLIKTDHWTSLNENCLDSLLRIVTTGPSLSHWDPSGAFDLWWRDKKRKNGGDAQTCREDCNTITSPGSNFDLEDWESWLTTD